MNTLIIIVVCLLVVALIGVLVIAVHLEALAVGVYSDDQVERLASEHFRNSHARRNQSFDPEPEDQAFMLDVPEHRTWT